MSSMLMRASRVAARAACSAVTAASRRAAGAGSAGAAAMPLPRSTPVASPTFIRRCLSSHMDGSNQGRDAFVVDEDLESSGPEDREAFLVDVDKDLESDEALWALYERWCKFFGEERSREEMQRRIGSKFKEAVLFVDHYNKKAIRDGNSCRLEVNMFADGKLRETVLTCQHSPIFGRAGYRPFSNKGSEEEDFTKGSLFVKEGKEGFTKGSK